MRPFSKLALVFSSALRLTVFVSIVSSLLGAQSYLTGLVFEKQGTGVVPVAGARVEARLAAEDKVIRSVETDEFGRYVLSALPAARVVITATHPRYYPALRSGRGGKTAAPCPEASPCPQVDFEMLPAGALEVIVVDSLGLPVEDVTVRIRRLDEPDRAREPTLAVRTARGVFRGSGMRPGPYEVAAEPVKRRAVTYHGVAALFDFPHGQDKEHVRLVMPSEPQYRVSGRILGLEAADAPWMLVVLEPEPEDAQEGERRPRLGAPLESSGHFAVNGVPRGSFSLKLVWGEDSGLDLAASPWRLLAKIHVEGDLPGLLFTAPPDLGSQ